MALQFTGAGYVRFLVGSSEAFQEGTYSVAALVQVDINQQQGFFGATTSANVRVLGTGTNAITGVHYAQTGAALVEASGSAITSRIENGWVLVGFDKLTGTNTPRFHAWKPAAGTQDHVDATGTLIDAAVPMGAGGFFYVGSPASGSDFWSGYVAWVAVWEGTRLTDANYNSMQAGLYAVHQLAPTHLWVMNGTSIVDSMGNGSTETSRVSTFAADPPGIPPAHDVLSFPSRGNRATMDGSSTLTMGGSTTVLMGGASPLNLSLQVKQAVQRSAVR